MLQEQIWVAEEAVRQARAVTMRQQGSWTRWDYWKITGIEGHLEHGGA